MRLGVHVPIAKGIVEAVAYAERLSCTAMQIFSRSPRGGPAPERSSEELDRFHHRRRQADITPLAVHGPYIMNLASPEPPMWKRSVAMLRDEYRRVRQLHAEYLVIHLGSHLGRGATSGIARVAEAISRTLDAEAGDAMILLENAAGSGQSIGSRFEQLAEIRRAVRDRARVGCCLDTAHLFAAGFSIHTATGLNETVTQFDRVVGMTHLRLMHLNDSKVPFDSRVDRHWHIGEGQIGMEGMRRIVMHPRLARVPFILETPKKSDREDRKNLATVRRLAGARVPVTRDS